MTPFQQFRLWARRAPATERILAGLAALLVLAALTFVVVPAHSTPRTTTLGVNGSSNQPASTGNQTTGQAQAGSNSVAGGSTTRSGGNGPGSSTAVPAGGASSISPGQAGGSNASGTPAFGAGPATRGTNQAGQQRTCPATVGNVPGVTASQVKVAVTLENIVGPAGNSAFDIPSAQQQQDDYQWVIDSINADGGAGCRQIVPLFYTNNSADPSGEQQICLDIVQAHPFAEIDIGGYLGTSADCFPQNGIPYIGVSLKSASELAQFYPYMFAFQIYDTLDHDTVYGLQQRGFFNPTNGFRKLGIIYHDCDPQEFSEEVQWLKQAGVASSGTVSYDIGCPASFGSPSTIEQAVLKFQQAGVTNVTEVETGADFFTFTDIAQQQGFKPKYGLPDEGIIMGSYGTDHPDYANIAGAVIITQERAGEQSTPGMTPSAATTMCNKILVSHGQQPVWQEGQGEGGIICDEMWMFAAAVDHSPVMARNALAAGLQAAESVDFSFPFGPNNFTGYHVTYGGQYWRVGEFMSSCTCWQVIDATFHPGPPA